MRPVHALLVPLGLLLAACGGGPKHAASASPNARAVFRVQWPERGTRLIPNAANSLVVALTKDGQTVARSVIARPAAGSNQTQTSFQNLPVGTLGVEVDAFPSTDGSGTAQAAATSTLDVVAGQTATVSVSLVSTVATLQLTPTPLSVASGATATLTASAKDAQGSLVLLAAGGGEERLDWSSSAPAVATASGTGTVGTVSGVSRGSAVVTARLTVSDGGATVAGQATVAVAPAISPWPSLHGDAQNTGLGVGPRAAGTGLRTLAARVGGDLPVLSGDGVLYVNGPSNSMIAVDAATGAQIWIVATGSAPGSGTLDAGGSLYFTTSGGRLYALDAATGAARWHIDDGLFAGTVVVADGVVYAQSSSGFAALDAATGSLFWRNAGVVSSYEAPALGRNGVIYVYGHSGSIFALDTATGAQRWRYDGPRFSDEPLVVGKDGSVYAAYITGGSDFVFAALDGATGVRRWAITPFNYSLSAPAVDADGILYVSESDGYLRALDPGTGTEIWNSRLVRAADPRTKPTLSGDGLLYMVNDFKLMAIDTRTHAQSWQVSLPGSVEHSPLVAADGTLYFRGSDSSGLESIYSLR